MSIKVIFCRNSINCIGKNNKLLYHIPEDLQYFKKQTQGHVVIMGRHTWNSLPDNMRPLPDRTNVVLSRTNKIIDPPDYRARDLNTAVSSFIDRDRWIIGGGGVINEAMKIADELHVTTVIDGTKGDVYIDDIDSSVFELTHTTEIMKEGGYNYIRTVFNRIGRQK